MRELLTLINSVLDMNAPEVLAAERRARSGLPPPRRQTGYAHGKPRAPALDDRRAIDSKAKGRPGVATILKDVTGSLPSKV